MLKMWSRRRDDGRMLVVIGLTHANIESLLDGNAIQVDGRTLGLPEVDTVTLMAEVDDHMLSRDAAAIVGESIDSGASLQGASTVSGG